MEILVGVLSAFILLLMVLFVGVVVYSRRQKLLTPQNNRRANNIEGNETKVRLFCLWGSRL